MATGGLADRFNFSSIKSALNSAVNATTQAAKDVSRAVATEVVGAQCLQAYQVAEQSASGGPCCLWRIYTARAKKEGANPLVSAWILDKRALEAAGGGGGGGGGGGHHAVTRPSARRLESFLEQCRRDVQALARLKHPGVMRLVHPLEETRTQLVFLTEPVFASLADLLPSGDGGALPAALGAERRALRLGELEVKHGLLQVAEALHFLHSEAGLVHKAVSPPAVVVTAGGAWKLAAFGHAAPLDFKSPDSLRAYDYSTPDPSLLAAASQPPLPYVAPELVASGTAGVTSAADVFSLGALAYELLSGRQLLPVGHSLAGLWGFL